MALTLRCALLAMLGAPVALIWPSWFWLLYVALAAGVVFDLVGAGAPSGLSVTRAGDVSTRLGETAAVSLLVSNRGRRTVRGRVRDAWPPSAGSSPRDQELVVPPGERRRIDTTLTPTRRGERRPDRVSVRSVGPLGLAARQRSTAVPWGLRVLPSFASRKHLPSRLARLRELDGAVATHIRGEGTEFDSLREYVVGDDVRSVDWRATARRGDVVVRTWRPERDRHVLVVLDTGRTSAGRIADTPRLDWSMDATLLLAALASRAGDRVDLIAVDRTVRAAVERASVGELLASLVAAMTPLEPALVEPDHRRVLAEVVRRTRRRSLIVVLTALDPAAFEEGWMPVLRQLSRRHVVVVASVADPLVEEMAHSRGDAAAVYGAAAAERARGERRRVSTALRRFGIEVVDAPPDEFAPALADAYLALKAAGRL
ncbi:MAG: hypothetical protein QOJ92_2609 [Frankiales bacterium]|nr:hypothetical protein [Frankiales bacterium]